ncbi:MAG: pilus assembly PilX N-terminal domain-containing protein [Candidatus Omnitrophica bacterium]|nr:pilus assembly PilX N-terminal domain-containing protein [Candidatus Omnitrophota bacterium]
MNKRGAALIICYMVIAALILLASAFLTRSISERSVTGKYFDSTQAFWLAEAGLNKAIFELRTSYDGYPTSISGSLSSVQGEYSATITSDANDRIVTASGFIPSASAVKTKRVIVATMIKRTPTGFYDNAIYSAGGVSIGSDCEVNGDVISGGTVTGNVEEGYDITQNDTTLHNNGLPLLSFDQLQQKSIDQGWYNPITHATTYPIDSFWYEAPSESNPTGTPNVVFVNGDFTLVGGQQVVKGFIVVGGNTVYDAEIGGNASIDGCLYTRGNIWMHGGGGNIINVNGGIWAGGTTTMTGNEQIDFNQDYMDAIEGLGINADVQVISWRETQNTY